MARFPYYKDNTKKLGKLLARARIDFKFREKLIANPKLALEEVGLPECVLQLMSFEVIDGNNQKSVVLPYKLNQNKLDRADANYLQSLAHTFTRAN